MHLYPVFPVQIRHCPERRIVGIVHSGSGDRFSGNGIRHGTYEFPGIRAVLSGLRIQADHIVPYAPRKSF